MTHSFVLVTGQWADLPLEVLAKKVSDWGYDGLELACWQRIVISNLDWIS